MGVMKVMVCADYRAENYANETSECEDMQNAEGVACQ